MAEGEPKKAASIWVTPWPFVKEVMFENVTIITNNKISRKFHSHKDDIYQHFLHKQLDVSDSKNCGFYIPYHVTT